MVTDSISDYFFVTVESGADNLRKEGTPGKSIHFVEHVMIDNLLYHIDKCSDKRDRVKKLTLH